MNAVTCGRQNPQQLLPATAHSMMNLCAEIALHGPEDIAEIHMCNSNQGFLAVPWEQTERVLQSFKVRTGGCGHDIFVADIAPGANHPDIETAREAIGRDRSGPVVDALLFRKNASRAPSTSPKKKSTTESTWRGPSPVKK